MKLFTQRLWRQRRAGDLRHRLVRPIALMLARFSPAGRYGLPVNAGLLILIIAIAAFGAISEDVVTGDPLVALDLRIAQWFHIHATTGTTTLMRVISDLHSVPAVSGYVLLLALYLIRRREWLWLWCLGLAVPGGMLLNELMKFSFGRVRPNFEHALVTLTSFSYPSGHVAGATLIYGMLSALLVFRNDVRHWRLLIIGAALGMVIIVGLSRLYLGVHYLSDVLAAFAEALAWLSLCLTATCMYRARHPRAIAQP